MALFFTALPVLHCTVLRFVWQTKTVCCLLPFVYFTPEHFLWLLSGCGHPAMASLFRLHFLGEGVCIFNCGTQHSQRVGSGRSRCTPGLWSIEGPHDLLQPAYWGLGSGHRWPLEGPPTILSARWECSQAACLRSEIRSGRNLSAVLVGCRRIVGASLLMRCVMSPGLLGVMAHWAITPSRAMAGLSLLRALRPSNGLRAKFHGGYL